MRLLLSTPCSTGTLIALKSREPVGKYFLQLCTTTPCQLCGSTEVLEAIKAHLKISQGETTEDGKFTLVEVECAGACVNAPVLAVNDDYYEDLTPEIVVDILKKLKRGEMPKAGPQQQRRTCEPKGGLTSLTTEPTGPGIRTEEAEKTPGPLYDFVRAHGGNIVISKVLIANNGIAAVKGIRSIRKWAYETFNNENEVELTVMATPEDLRVNAEYIRMADRCVEVPGGANNNNFANVDLIVDIAERTGVHVCYAKLIFQAVWAGWGHASENPRLPEKLAATKSCLAFIGPPSTAMRSLGDKISSTIVAQSASVPTLPWSGSHLTETATDPKTGFPYIPESIYTDATVQSLTDGIEKAKKIGYPLMIKASEGGGGKGIRKVTSDKEFHTAYEQVISEVPGSPVFIMKLAENVRHLEVQILADEYGNAISLFGRDCSVQRRHQKIIEEAPVTIAPPETFRKMEQAAVRLAKLVGYVSAGTVEYLYDTECDKFYFLELNPRLQVSGVNLPATQLQIAMGIPLYRIKDIKDLYNFTSDTNVNFLKFSTNISQPKGHVIAVRITAENPDAGFQPSSGRMHELNFRSSAHVWGYFSVAASGGLHEYADSQFGHIFAFGETRELSRKNMVVALKQLSIRSDFRTTVEYLIRLLEADDFVSNKLTTSWLDNLISGKMATERPEPILVAIFGAVHRFHTFTEQQKKDFFTVLEKGQFPEKDALKTDFNTEFVYDGVKYQFTATRSGDDSFVLYLRGCAIEVAIRRMTDDGLLIQLGGKSFTAYFRDEIHRIYVMFDGKTGMIEQEQDPTQLLSPSPGKLARWLVSPDQKVTVGQVYAEIEVMKMLMSLVANATGTVKPIKQPGTMLEPGELIGIMTLADPGSIRHAQPFKGQVPEFGPATVPGEKLHQKVRDLKSKLCRWMDGYNEQNCSMETIIKELYVAANEPVLPFLEFDEALATLVSRIPLELEQNLKEYCETGTNSHEKGEKPVFSAKRLQHIIEKTTEKASKNDTLTPLYEILEKYRDGIAMNFAQFLIGLLDRFYDVESRFDEENAQEAVTLRLREEFKDQPDEIARIFLSHRKLSSRNLLVLALCDVILGRDSNQLPKIYIPCLKRLAGLSGRKTTKVALRAREILIRSQFPSFEQRYKQMEFILRGAVTESVYGTSESYRTPSYDSIKDLVLTNFQVLDVLQRFFYHKDQWIGVAALEVYVRRTYNAYTIINIKYYTDEGELEDERFKIEWKFSAPDKTGIERRGVMSACDSFENLEAALLAILQVFPSNQTSCYDIVSLAVEEDPVAQSDDAWRERLLSLVAKYIKKLRKHGIQQITFLITRQHAVESFFTFCEENDYQEDSTIRHIDPALAYQLELPRLNNFNIEPFFIENRQFHIYYATGKANSSDRRFFVRVLVWPGRLKTLIQTKEYLISESDRLISDILDALEITSSQRPNSDCNHLYINFMPVFSLEFEEVEAALQGFVERHGRRLWRLRVTGAEIRFQVQSTEFSEAVSIRFCVTNVSGCVVQMDTYAQVQRKTDNTWVYKSLSEKKGELHLQPIMTPYQTKDWQQPRRYKAHVLGTTYVYDFPELFRNALKTEWEQAVQNGQVDKVPEELIAIEELMMDEHGQLVPVKRSPGGNSCGMVAWQLKLKTPEFPNSREIILIANDITHKSGTFGTAEDEVFFRASELARSKKIPRVYIAANSGARFGLADEVLQLFKAEWIDSTRHELGCHYLYLLPKDYEKVKDSVVCEFVTDKNIYKITSVIGSCHGLGVENLQGSGKIAGETSRAYREIFTISLVSCRSVGIGAYLIRLGQRTVQVQGHPIILTGVSALNRVLGRPVYSSNLQLGGTPVMHGNGIAHLVAMNDLQGISQMLKWIALVPSYSGGPLPLLPSSDSISRPIEFIPPNAPYDPRWLLAGKTEDESWLGGLLDRNSFQETLGGWAPTVVVGRGRLGGIPVAVIAVETRTIETRIPADPADNASTESVIREAGQVWHPNSAFKTAQSISDFDHEQLPLIILANWRGFSGGQRDLPHVLKYGAMIVDALCVYSRPVLVYIVPNGELRGGAWVVLDPSINPAMMELYADPQSRGGVLEAEGVVEILKPKVGEYSSLVHFAQLHDTPQRMLAKKTINGIVPWAQWRKFAYDKLIKSINR